MKIKNFRLFAGGFIAFFLIGTLRSCEETKLKQEQKAKEMFNQTIKEIKFEDIFIPADNNNLEELIEEKLKKNR